MLFQHKEQLYTKDNLIIIITGKIKNQSEIEEQLAPIINHQKNQVFLTKKPSKTILLYQLIDLNEMIKQDMLQAY
jgi:hypothetical protein